MAGLYFWLHILVLSLFSALSPAQEPAPKLSRDANHIFNTIHSSMRQFGSSLRHNGMSIFLASVPADTQFYHGNASPDPVQGMEWLAFEPEHAIQFAWRFLKPPPGRPPADQDVLQVGVGFREERVSPLQALLEHDGPEPPLVEPGWLHTYRTRHALRLVYLDGMSAAKSTNGTLDFGDFLVLQEDRSHPPWWDTERGQKLCRLASDEWQGNIDGFLRMEAGFEIILCDFEKHLTTVHVHRVDNLTAGFDEKSAEDTFFSYWRALSERFDSIGGERVKIYFDRFVTAYGRGLDLFHGTAMPRLLAVDDEQRASIRHEIDKLVTDSQPIFAAADQWIDWQAVVDMIVTRYSSRIRYLTSKKFSSNIHALRMELIRTLAPFIDYDHRNVSVEIRKCASYYLPEVRHSSQASDAIISVARHICETLFLALEHSRQESAECDPSPYNLLENLVHYLDWTDWRRCGACKEDELCMLPIWPYGSTADHEHPRCRNATLAWSQTGYWGHQRPWLLESNT